MALHLGTGHIETRGTAKIPKLQAAVEHVLEQLGWERTYEGKGPPEEDPEDEASEFELKANPEGVLAIRVSEDQVVRDLARMVSEKLEIPLEVFTTVGTLYGRRAVEVKCRRFSVKGPTIEELPVMATHTAEVTDVEHNELRQAPNALRQRINGANDSLLEAEASSDFKLKKVLRFKRKTKKIKWSSARLGRLMGQIETCESFEVQQDGDQPIVQLVLKGGVKSSAYLKPEELAELEKALEGRPELAHRRLDSE